MWLFGIRAVIVDCGKPRPRRDVQSSIHVFPGKAEGQHKSLNMTLAALYPQYASSEVGVGVGVWGGVCGACLVRARGCKRPEAAHAPAPLLPAPAPPRHHLQRLADTLKALRLSGWYYGDLDWQGARSLLQEASVGAFVVRDSGDRNFIFSLSVQTERGPTSVRIHYEGGFFRLDCATGLARCVPRFRCVVELCAHYVRSGGRHARGVWVDGAGAALACVRLQEPRVRRVPSLLHAARLATHRALAAADHPATPTLWSAPKHRLLPLPPALLDYLGEYPYTI